MYARVYVRACILHVSSLSSQEGFFDLQEALQAIYMRQETLREQLAHARSKGEETATRNIQVSIVATLTVALETWGRKE